MDLVIIVLYFAVIIAIGVYFSRRNKDVSEYALGGRSIPWWAVLASILAAEISAGTFFGAPGEGFRLQNYTYAQLMIGYLLARLVVSGVFIPAFTNIMWLAFTSFWSCDLGLRHDASRARYFWSRVHLQADRGFGFRHF